MTRHQAFALAIAVSSFVTLLLAAPILLGDCYMRDNAALIQRCLAARDRSILVYAVTAALFGVLSLGLHARGERFATFAALLGLMLAPFFITLAFAG